MSAHILEKHKEPFIDNRGARIYEWFNNEVVKFRLVVDDLKSLETHGAQNRTAQQLNDDIITYFSNRFSDKIQNFKNPAVEAEYKKQFLQNESQKPRAN